MVPLWESLRSRRICGGPLRCVARFHDPSGRVVPSLEPRGLVHSGLTVTVHVISNSYVIRRASSLVQSDPGAELINLYGMLSLFYLHSKIKGVLLQISHLYPIL